MKKCQECGRETSQGLSIEVGTPIPYRMNGWVGNNFIPYEDKYKGVKLEKRHLCGICYGLYMLEQEGSAVTNDELREALLAMARKEGAPVEVPNLPAPQGGNGKSTPPSSSSIKRNRASVKRMSADEARYFNSFSHANVTLLMSMLKCRCQPYDDVFTFKRWLAQGLAVQKGQHGYKLQTSHVFCRCQVADAKGWKKGVAA